MEEDRPTIYDVARQCGVAASTVSRTFSNPTRVSAVTRERVREAAREVGYEPRPLARAEAPGRIRVLTLVVTDISNPYYSTVIKAAQDRAIERGYTLALTDSDESARVEASNLRQLLATTSGGILATSRLSDETVQQIAAHRPLVMVNRRIEGVPSLVIDTAAGMRKAVRHLAVLGHHRIAYLSGPRNSWINGQRWQAVREESCALGLEVSFLGPFAPNRRGGQEAADALVLEKVTAAIGYNDLIAIGVLQRLQVIGVRVPDDLSLIGCDDVFGADLTVPGLTTIAGPADKLGSYAVDVLHARLTGNGEGPGSLTLDAHMVLRASTGAAPRVAS
ncbi:LacI family DNA-binding transcriptional regulator [Saccharopolyspora sp. TS4A08]|uniref:LacI family DNA-binding transcriptional regulator n=1 Tax=Saccharopolyspora ipomoeae TaxID=3042027 RepID=A0ABT6PQG7_9PSEU|nr:LacI family DNA-binding transcriptional regulator [Saccharopolyspora sp. TS4A08]MDI2030237.1 LacI family DNA-binding transcriptional regulator [Saccharopolyspora sp. TS4A08]